MEAPEKLQPGNCPQVGSFRQVVLSKKDFFERVKFLLIKEYLLLQDPQ